MVDYVAPEAPEFLTTVFFIFGRVACSQDAPEFFPTLDLNLEQLRVRRVCPNTWHCILQVWGASLPSRTFVIIVVSLQNWEHPDTKIQNWPSSEGAVFEGLLIHYYCFPQCLICLIHSVGRTFRLSISDEIVCAYIILVLQIRGLYVENGPNRSD